MFSDLTGFVQRLADNPGRVYGDLFPIVLIVSAAVIVLHFVLALLTRPGSPVKAKRWNVWEKLIYVVLLLCVFVLGGTSFYSVIRYGIMEGWILFAHMVGAGGLVAVLPLIAVTWAEPNRFGRRGRVDGPDSETSGGKGEPRRFFWLTKLTFWIVLASGLVTVWTMLLSMLPLLGTEDLHRLLDVHRYSGLLLVVATIFHLYGVWLRRLGLR